MSVTEGENEFASHGDRIRLNCILSNKNLLNKYNLTNIILKYRDDLTNNVSYGRIYEVILNYKNNDSKEEPDIQISHRLPKKLRYIVNSNGYEMKIKKHGDLVKGENKDSIFIKVYN